ncbi:xanthine dehydrogenase family protein molybdopterin-binding subunit [Oricola cellulosilytica]|uniref:Xanthine dehydrogenase family protein molybdopterin-binding subunit n=1 Tax=Oricola cellulosilytica TaxID=1429082 RepID=A0A4R0PGJ0_9HYPH|nr:molybdopterin cofactor-binding domain-containing protein [Oricola cellulosilytica]TCD15964.1 xanthine dehydrogenase family protein molybdopterin-binding subunit [Oricola cellulosilytica]
MGKILRRTFLVGTGVIAGGLAVGFYTGFRPHENPLEAGLADGESTFNPFVRIDAGGKIHVIVPRAEMGQGVTTTLAALVAEELGVGLSAVEVEHGPAAGAYYNSVMLEESGPYPVFAKTLLAETTRALSGATGRLLGLQVTGGSSSVRDAFEKMRHAGAVARYLLLQAASEEMGEAVPDLLIEGTEVVSASGERVSLGVIGPKAALIKPPSDLALKDPSEWTLLGKPQQRTDLLAKVTGAPIFGIDTDLPNMVYGTVRMSPRLGAGIRSFDMAAAEAMPGVIKIVRMDTQTGTGFGVIAENTWAAFQAARAIDVEWEDAPYPDDTNAIMEVFRGRLDSGAAGSSYRDDGDVEAAFADAPADLVLTADYEVPYLAHAAMEPMNATAWLRDGKLDIWAPNQAPTVIQTVCAGIAGIDAQDVAVNTTYLGGGFGRRGEVDFSIYATLMAMNSDGRPVKVTWTREEDTSHDTYRPAAAGRFRARVDADGAVEALDMRIATPSIIKSVGRRTFPSLPTGGPERLLTEGAFDQPYTIPNYRVTGVETEMPVPVGFWRSVGYSFNGYFHESFLDEIAEKTGQDPIEMRIRLMSAHPEAVMVMKKLAQISGWARRLPDGRAKGVAFTLSFGSYVGEVVQVAQTPSGIRVEKVWAVADVGRALDPGIVKSQIESGIVFGLSSALGQEITISDGRVEQQNFYDYDAMRIHQCPEFEVVILENAETIGGVGEIGTPPSIPALANAIYALTGERIRTMPLGNHIAFT